jgi:L-ascorbate metabolism protein UlaG (beta-lactamase superfamily)
LRQDEEFLEEVRAHAARQDGVRVWWLGQSGFLLQWRGRHLLVDPYLSDSLTKKYARTDKPHVRMSERVVAPERLGFVALATASHQHTDHLDPETLIALRRANPMLRLVVPEAHRTLASERLGVAPESLIGIDAGGAVEGLGLRVHAVASAHETIERDEAGRCLYLGYVFELGEFRLYHSGDTVRYEGMAESLRRWPIDLALLPINGRGPERRVAGNLWGREAAQLAKDIGAAHVIPCHYDMFEFNTATPEEFTRECERLGQAHTVLEQGEMWQGPEG